MGLWTSVAGLRILPLTFPTTKHQRRATVESLRTLLSSNCIVVKQTCNHVSVWGKSGQWLTIRRCPFRPPTIPARITRQREAQENLDEISGDDADLKKESSSGKKLRSNTMVIGQPGKSVGFGQLSLTSSSSHQKDWRQREPLERPLDEQE